MSESTLAFSAWMMLICSSRIFLFSSLFLLTSLRTSCRACSTQSITAWNRALTWNVQVKLDNTSSNHGRVCRWPNLLDKNRVGKTFKTQFRVLDFWLPLSSSWVLWVKPGNSTSEYFWAPRTWKKRVSSSANRKKLSHGWPAVESRAAKPVTQNKLTW